jgi:RNA polymerase sigma factor for flagellar operon FliA
MDEHSDETIGDRGPEVDRRTLAELAAASKRTIEFHARRLHRKYPNIEHDDFAQCGQLGRIQAYKTYDPKGHAAFATFAKARIVGAMIDEVRKSDRRRLGRVLAAAADDALDDIEARAGEQSAQPRQLGLAIEALAQQMVTAYCVADASEYSTSPEQSLLGREALAELLLQIEQLPRRHKECVRLKHFDMLSTNEIAARLKIAKSRVSHLLHEAEARLRQTMRSADTSGT